MRKRTRIELAVPWPKAREHLSRGLAAKLPSYLVDPELSNLIAASFVFDDDDPVLAEFVAHVKDKTIGAPGAPQRLFGKGGARAPLLRLVRYWTEYDFQDLAGEPAVELLIQKQVPLVFPLSQYYRAELEFGTECAACGRVVLHPKASLRVGGGHDQVEPAYGDGWQTGDGIAETTNHEVMISDRLRQRWPASGKDDREMFLPVDSAGRADRLWQLRPSGLAQVKVPPTPLQVRERCATCGRPVIVALGIASEALPGQAAEPVVEQEALLTVTRASIADGDFWETDLEEGRIRFERDLLERFVADPEPFYVRTARPFWLISNRVLRLLHDSNPAGWRCKPVAWV